MPTFSIVENGLFCLKMHTFVGKLLTLSVDKYNKPLKEMQLEICRFHCSLSQKGSRPLS